VIAAHRVDCDAHARICLRVSSQDVYVQLEFSSVRGASATNVAQAALSGFVLALMRTASRPLYQPQLAQAWCARFC